MRNMIGLRGHEQTAQRVAHGCALVSEAAVCTAGAIAIREIATSDARRRSTRWAARRGTGGLTPAPAALATALPALLPPALPTTAALPATAALLATAAALPTATVLPATPGCTNGGYFLSLSFPHGPSAARVPETEGEKR